MSKIKIRFKTHLSGVATIGSRFDKSSPIDMGTHIKTTIDIADDLLTRAKRLAWNEDRTLREVVEEGLDLVLLRRARKPGVPAVLPTSGGDGLTAEFRGAGWEPFRDEIYRGRGA